MLDIHFSNRIEVLTDLLVERIGHRHASVFASDVIVVPSAAIRRHLTLRLVDRHGICANVQFAFLAQWLWEQVAAVDPTVSSRSPFDPAVLTWHVFSALSEADWVKAHPRLASYLQQSDPLMRHELATQIAGVLSHYITYRSDWLEAWQQGRTIAFKDGLHAADEPWQAELWRQIVRSLAIDGPNPLVRFSERLRHGVSDPLIALPAEVHIFGLPDIPPLHLQVLRELGRHTAVHLYLLNPCSEFWFDVVDPRRMAYLTALGKAEHIEVGNRLLSAWGKQTQSQLGLMIDTLDTEIQEASFIPSGQTSLLGRLQDAMLTLTDLEPGSHALAPSDRSIECHACHSRSRELEVLHDRLLALFKADPTLRADDVLVVTPDLSATAPHIDAVFGSVSRNRNIPHAVTGLARSRINPIARTLIDLLSLAGSRWRLSEVLGFIGQAPVCRRLGMDAQGLEQAREWLRSAGVHWAINGAHRAAMELPATERHSFQDGLHRLFLAYSLPVGTTVPFKGLLPAGNPEGSGALMLGTLWRFLERLERFRQEASRPRISSQWAQLIDEALTDFVQSDPQAPEDLQEVRAALERFVDQSAQALADHALPLEVVRAAIADLLDDPARGGLPSGAVTFSSLASLRGLSYRVVCLIGFDDSAFPTVARPAEFDLMPLQARPGDRQRQADDRGLFLDLLLAARDHLHVSYVGRSIRDNSALPPSVLVSELLDYLVPVIAGSPQDHTALRAARARLLVEHPLQPFSPRAFSTGGDPRIRSFNQTFAQALARREASQTAGPIGPLGTTHAPGNAGDDADDGDEDFAVDHAAQPFFVKPLSALDIGTGEISLESLFRFLKNPSRSLLEHRLGIALDETQDLPDDDEPFLLGGLERRVLSDRLLPPLLSGAPLEAVREMALAGVELPSGDIGRAALMQTLGDLNAVAQRLRPLLADTPVPPIHLRVPLAVSGQSFQLTASITDLRAQGLIRGSSHPARAIDYLDAWLHFLVLSAAQPDGVAPQVTWVHTDVQIQFAACDGAHGLLSALVALWKAGMECPLYFFPKTAWAYMRHGGKRSEAVKTWRASEHNHRAEGSLPAHRLALRGRQDPMGESYAEFERCARAVFGPLMDHLRES